MPEETKAPFRMLSHDEFGRLTTKQRIDYLREAIAALEDLRAQMSTQIMHDTADTIRSAAKGPDEQF